MPQPPLQTTYSEVDLYRGAQDDEEFNPYKEDRPTDLGLGLLEPDRPLTYHSASLELRDEGSLTEEQQGDARSGAQHRLGLIPILPALLSSLVTTGAASLLLTWLLTRRVTTHPSDENDFFHSAIVAAEGKHGSITDLLRQVLGAQQNVTGNVETTMYALAISTVTVHIVSFTIPFVLGVFGYWLAFGWIRDQERRHRDDLPTPTQYGLILALFGSFGFTSAYDTMNYISRRRRTRPAIPTILISAFVAVTIALCINYTLWLAQYDKTRSEVLLKPRNRIFDLWLHTTSSTFSHQFISPVPSNILPAVGSEINTTLCPGPFVAFVQTTVNPPTGDAARYANCLHFAVLSGSSPVARWGTIDVINEGAAIINNNSILSQVVLINDIAVLLPKMMPNDMQRLIFSTFALSTTCAPVTDCAAGPSTDLQVPEAGDSMLFCPSFSPPLNLSLANGANTIASSMVQQFNASTDEMIFAVNNASDTGYRSGSTINPAGALVALFWNQVDAHTIDLPPPPGDNQSGWYVWNMPPTTTTSAFYVASCQVTVYNVTMSYTSPSNGTASQLSFATEPTPSNFNTTSAFLGALDPLFQATLASHISTVLQPSLNASRDVLIAALEGNMSVSLLSYTAPIAMRATASEANSVTQVPVTRYPLAPLSALLALLYGYALISLALCSGAVLLRSRDVVSGTGTRSQSAITLVQQRLMSPRAIVADRFRTEKDVEDSMVTRDAIFEEGKDAPRLGTGLIVETGDADSDGEGQGILRRRVRRFRVDEIERFGKAEYVVSEPGEKGLR
ncbi:hypothetical protein K488DRAFT_69694 [Vararia minispora EC-137]|uniref:Uncharacterized protein n=1 Tax=Vararia minispora EC-137 TaxID=1314806 RepID=A0ACB8QPI0_9AGAM|nr:hypothetical protein K488DRAFT_69694 [Vararia minispora EC-137]